MKIRELDVEFRKSGRTFTQVKSNEYAYIYKVEFDIHDINVYEVFKRKLVESHPIYNKNDNYDIIIQYPNDESFGYWAWTYNNLESAIDKYNKISNI